MSLIAAKIPATAFEEDHGELVAIVPHNLCNGLYFWSIRQGTKSSQGAGNGGLGHHRILLLHGLNQPAKHLLL